MTRQHGQGGVMIDETTRALINFFSDLKIRNIAVEVCDISADKYVSEDMVGDEATIENLERPMIVVDTIQTNPDRRRMRGKNERLILDKSQKIDIPYPIAIDRIVSVEMRTFRQRDEIELLAQFLQLMRDGVDMPVLFEFEHGYKWEPLCHVSPTQPILRQSTTIDNYYYGLQLAQYSVKTWLPVSATVFEYPVITQRVLRRTRMDNFDEISYEENLDQVED